MPVTDPIADMLTRIRNASRVSADEVRIPASRLKISIAKILREEGFIKHYKVVRAGSKGGRDRDRDRDRSRNRDRQERGKAPKKKGVLLVLLKYGPRGEPVINGLRRISKPGLRKYVGRDELRQGRREMGMLIISTSRGFMSDKEAIALGIGGVAICRIW